MRVPGSRNWTGEQIAKPITDEATPAATIDKLVMADQYPLDAATLPYAGCGRIFDGVSDPNRKTRHLGLMVAPGAVQAVGAVSRSWMMGPNIGENTQSWTQTGGTGGADVVTTHDMIADFTADQAALWFAAYYCFGFGACPIQVVVETGSAGIQNAPTGSQDRQYELNPQGTPYVEPMMVTRAAGFSVAVSLRVKDLESL